MESFIFDQIRFTRDVTLFTAKNITEAKAILIPEGFNNNILWNLGHIYLTQEQSIFSSMGEPVLVPDEFVDLFAMGTKPSDWVKQPPKLEELFQLLKEQPDRIREQMNNRLNEAVASPLTLPGLTLKTIGEFISLSLYHEGVHVQAIRTLQKLSR